MKGDEVKAYLYLLCESWLEDPRATLPNDDVDLALMAKLPMESWLKVKPRVMANFILTDNRWINEKLAGISSTQTKFRKWGEMGGNPSLIKIEPKEVNPSLSPTLKDSVNLASASASASSINKEYNSDFELFWRLYPRRVAKGNAYREWLKIKPTAELVSAILESLKLQIPTWKDVKYVKHPERWLKAECWKDEIKSGIRKDSCI